MTYIGMTYDEWREQFGNPLGLDHDGTSRRITVESVNRAAEEGMKGFVADND